MRQDNLGATFINKLKLVRLQVYSRKVNFYKIAMTEHGEPVLLGTVGSEGDSLTIQLLYTDTIKFYRSTLLASFIDDQMLIGDIKVLYKPSYSPKLRKPYRRGYGTLLINQALDVAEQRGIKKVTGDMVSFDDEEKKRQINFCTKCGFTIDSQNKLLKLL